MRLDRLFLRRMDAGAALEAFFIAAVLTVLTVRFLLHLTGYPQLGGSHLHVAHVLWGGLLLALAVLMLLAFLTGRAHRVAAVIGGIGFGLFIDEVGKFLTRDTNYFYLPAVSIIYLVFVLIFIGVRTIRTVRPFNPTEHLLNAIASLQEIALRDLDPEERRRALGYLSACDPDEPLVEPLRRMIEQTATIALPPPHLLTTIRRSTRRAYRRMAESPRFHAAIITFVTAELAIRLIVVGAALFFHGESVQQILSARLIRIFSRRLETLSVAAVGEAIATAISALLAVWGIVRLRSSRLGAFRMFERSVLVSILLTQPFAFYREQFWALLGLAYSILVRLALRFMIAREKAREAAERQA